MAIAAEGPVRSSDGGEAALARSHARAILAEARFHSPSVPRPLHGLLQTLGSALESPLNAVAKLVSSLGTVTPGGEGAVWGVLAAAVLALSGVLALRGARRALGGPGTPYAAGDGAPSARELELRAQAAETQGQLAEAVRLRFRAGLLRLQERELLDAAPSTLNAEVSRVLRSERFDALARRFEEIAYGGRAASEEDVRLAREEWSHLLERRSDE